MVSLTLALFVAGASLLGVAVRLRQPEVSSDLLYQGYSICDVIMPCSALMFILFLGATWFLVSRSPDVQGMFNEVFRDNQWVVQVAGVALFILFFATDARSVRHIQDIWAFTGKA